MSALWILLRTEIKAARSLRANSSSHKQLEKMAENLGFGKDGFEGRLKGLDHWLDDLESLLDDTAQHLGLD
jgi:hypothetical protein